MDVLTHGMMGIALAGPVLGTHPAEACGFILGSVAPDLDVLSRCFGKRAFLRWHQGWTHSFSVIVGFSAGVYAVANALWPEASGAALGLCLGAALHTFLDLTNTYGVRALAPFSRRRFCWEWLFFIDSFVIVLTIPPAVFAIMTLGTSHEGGLLIAMAYAVALLTYIAMRALLRRRARRLCPADVVSMIPSASWPWKYFTSCQEGEVVKVFVLNALSGRRTLVREQPIYDRLIREHLEPLPEFRAMSELSLAYHVVGYECAVDTVRVVCRDLRIVNFDTTFGMLDVVLGPDSKVISTNLRV